MRKGLVLCVVCMMICAGVPAAAQDDDPGEVALTMIADYVIAFDSDIDGDREIFLINGDGSNLVQLTDNEAEDGLVDWSPDGAQVVFFSDRDGDDEIFIMAADGSDPVQLTFNEVQDRAAAWSPDGTRIAFISTRDGNQEVYVMDADGSNPQRLTDTPTNEFWPDWSPDGAQIVYTAVHSRSNQELYVIDVPEVIDPDALPEAQLVAQEAARADWSPMAHSLCIHPMRLSVGN